MTHHESTQPELDASSEPLDADSPFTLPGFFAALAEGTLLGVVCADCGAALVPPRPACYACGSRDVPIEAQPRTGTVVSYTEVRVPPAAFAEEAPYTIAVVELDSGARLTGRVDVPYAEVGIDAPVRLTVREPTAGARAAALAYEEDWPLHVFELVE